MQVTQHADLAHRSKYRWASLISALMLSVNAVAAQNSSITTLADLVHIESNLVSYPQLL